MKEKSHIDDMRAALRGDIERARARRESEAAPPPEPEQKAEPQDEPAPTPGKLAAFFRRG